MQEFSLMIISSASVNSTISEVETWFPPSNFSHSWSCDTISSAALTLTYKNGSAGKIHIVLSCLRKFIDLPGTFEAIPLHSVLPKSSEVFEPHGEVFFGQRASRIEPRLLFQSWRRPHSRLSLRHWFLMETCRLSTLWKCSIRRIVLNVHSGAEETNDEYRSVGSEL